jgi:hypothetical protein
VPQRACEGHVLDFMTAAGLSDAPAGCLEASQASTVALRSVTCSHNRSRVQAKVTCCEARRCRRGADRKRTHRRRINDSRCMMRHRWPWPAAASRARPDKRLERLTRGDIVCIGTMHVVYRLPRAAFGTASRDGESPRPGSLSQDASWTVHVRARDPPWIVQTALRALSLNASRSRVLAMRTGSLYNPRTTVLARLQ